MFKWIKKLFEPKVYLDKPEELLFIRQETLVYLTWRRTQRASFYRIYRDGKIIGTSTRTHYQDIVKPGSNYRYHIVAVADEGFVSPPSDIEYVNLPGNVMLVGDFEHEKH